jgi:hypothetical protein
MGLLTEALVFFTGVFPPGKKSACKEVANDAESAKAALLKLNDIFHSYVPGFNVTCLVINADSSALITD